MVVDTNITWIIINEIQLASNLYFAEHEVFYLINSTLNPPLITRCSLSITLPFTLKKEEKDGEDPTDRSKSSVCICDHHLHIWG